MIYREQFTPKILNETIIDFVNTWKNSGNKTGEPGIYGSQYNGKDFTELKEVAWVNFPWQDLTGGEKGFIKSTWDRYSSGNVWPASQISDSSKQKDTGKFLFFDLFNLAPTLPEYNGYNSSTIYNWPDFYVHNISRIDRDYSPEDPTKIKNIYSLNATQKNQPNFAGNTAQLFSEKFNTLSKSDYYQHIIDDKPFGATGKVFDEYLKIRFPFEDEFKLSWMRDFVQIGLENRMGPFAADLKEDGTVNKHDDGTAFIRIGNISKLIEHRGDYKKAIFYQWAQSELDWANGKDQNFNKNYNYETDKSPKPPKEYLEAILTPYNDKYDGGQIGPELDGEYRLKSDYFLKDGSPAFLNLSGFNISTRKNNTNDISQGHLPFIYSGKNIDELNTPNYKMYYEDLFYVIGAHAGIIEGGFQENVQPSSDETKQMFIHLTNFTNREFSGLLKQKDSSGTGLDQEPDKVLIERKNIQSDKSLVSPSLSFSKYENIAIGIPPYYKTDEDRRNNIVSGWIVLPHLFGRLQLPWSFVWKYIGVSGFIKIENTPPEQRPNMYYNDGNPDDAIFNADNVSQTPYGADKKPSQNWLKQNARTRFWHFRYGIRTDNRKLSDSVDSFDNYWKGTNRAVYIFNRYNWNDIVTKKSLDWSTLEPEIPLRELFFYLRMKYGISRATGLRYVIDESINDTYTQISAIHGGGIPFDYSVIDDIVSKTNRVFPNVLYGLERGTAGRFNNESPRNPPTHLLRSKYISILHDQVGWPRYRTDPNPNEDYGNHQLPTPETMHTFSTDPNFALSEITDYRTTGFYSFCGTLTDRFPWILSERATRENSTWLEYKRDTRISVDANHLSFAYLLNNLETQTEGPRVEDGLDRYISPNLPLTYGKKFNVKKGKKQSYSAKEEFVDTEKFDHVWYYDHSVNQEYSPRDEFSPVLLSKKELQFIYEMVTYNLYGTEPKTTGIWDYTFSDRWAELNYRINIPLYDVSEKWYTRNMYGSEAIFNDSSYFAVDVNPNHIVTLSDYILWAAPTEDQFYKKQFSKTNNTFIQKYINQKSDKKDWVWQNNEPLSFLESKFPFSALSEYIIKSENSSRPIVPAFVHHRYISRLLNQEQKYNDVGIDNRSIKNDIIGSVVRTMGGKRLNQDSQDEGVLITLPSFVLGGRIDLGESIDDWDPTWGKVCPFSMQEYTYPDGTKKQMLIVGNLDDVIDSWAKGKTYKNPKDKNAKPKYVSAMEISFWIRYRQGLASAPTNRRVDNPIDTTNIVYNRTELKKESRWPWPISNIYINAPAIYQDEVNGGTLDIKTREETIFSLPGVTETSNFNLNFETLNGISMLTSYYNPIIVNNEQKPGLCIDPLIEIPTAKEGNQTNAYTGFNSRYACNWPGAPQVTGIRDLTSEAIFGATVTDFLLNNTVLSNKFSRDYLTVHKLYRTVQRGPNGKKSDGSSLTGFDYHKNDEECNKVILASDIQAWFKAYKVIEEINKFSDYISKGKELPPGTKNSVLEVEGRIGKRNDETETRDSFTAEDFTHFYISGESQGSTQTNWNNPTVLSYEEQMRIRPWNDRIEFGFASKQYDAVTAFASDYSLGSTGCIPNKRYMRHILVPNTFMYLSQRTEVGGQGETSSTPVYGAWYTYEQVDNIKKAIYDTLMVWNVPPDNDLNNTLSPGAKQYATLLKSNKWVKTLSKSGYDPNNKKDLRKFNSFDQFVTEYNATEKKAVWNSFALKLTTSILSSVTNVKYLSIAKLATTEGELIDSYFRANKALKLNYGHWFDNINFYSKINKFAKDQILSNLKVLLDAYDAGWFGARPKGLPDAINPEENVLFAIYKKGKPIVSWIEAQLESMLGKFLIEKATANIIRTGVIETAGAGGNVVEVVAVEETAGAILGTLIRLNATSLIISLAVAVVFYAIARIREDWEKDQQIQEMWKFLREAERYGYLEGPYLQSEGSIKIKKTVNNEIKVLGKKYIPSYEKNYALDKDEDPSESSKYKEGKPSVSVQERVNLEKMTSAELYKFVKTANDKFYETGGVFENILKDIRKDSCECDFLYSIVAYGEEPDMQVKDIRNREITEWATGSFKRRLFERENVLDEAPIFSDNPFVFISAPEPEFDTPWLPDNNSDQVGDAERQHSYQRLRSWGSSGIVVYEGDAFSGTRLQKYLCSRFWWPSLVVNQNTDLCQFMARDGKYPKRRAQWLYGCELNEGEPNQRISLTPEQDRLLDIEYQKPGRFFVRAAYSRVDNKSKNIPYVKFTGTSNVKNLSLRGSLLYTNSNNITEEKVGDRNINKGELFNYKYTRRTHPKSSTYGYGESLITAEGVNGPAPPHEREIVNIFRRKYKIDLVIPGHWTAGDKNYFNPKKDKSIGESTTFKPGGCCGMTEIVDPGEDVTFPEGGNEDPKSEDIGNNLKKKQQASYCEYVISLNTPEFKNAIKKKCKKEKKEEQKQEEKTEKKTDPTPISKPKTVTSKTPQIFIPTGGNMDAGVVSRTGRLDGVVMPGIRITWPNTRTATVEIKNQPEQKIKPTFQDTYKNANKDTVFGKVKVTTTNNTGKKDSTPGNNQPSTDDVRKRKTKKRTKTPLSTPLTPGQTVPTGGSMNSSTITNTTPDPPNDEIKTGGGKEITCFPSWTQISTLYGLVQIKDIKLGDSIYAFDQSGNTVKTEVSHYIEHNFEESSEVFRYSLSNGTTLDITENHGVLTDQNEFVQIGSLKLGDSLITETGEFVQILSKESIGIHEVYNISTKNYGTYFANGIRVSGDWNPTKESW